MDYTLSEMALKNKELSETIQENLITFMDGLPEDLIDNICQAVVDYYTVKKYYPTCDKTNCRHYTSGGLNLVRIKCSKCSDDFNHYELFKE